MGVSWNSEVCKLRKAVTPTDRQSWLSRVRPQGEESFSWELLLEKAEEEFLPTYMDLDADPVMVRHLKIDVDHDEALNETLIQFVPVENGEEQSYEISGAIAPSGKLVYVSEGYAEKEGSKIVAESEEYRVSDTENFDDKPKFRQARDRFDSFLQLLDEGFLESRDR